MMPRFQYAGLELISQFILSERLGPSPNRDRHNFYQIRITNEDSRKKDSLTVGPKSCNVFEPTDAGEYSVRVYKNGRMFSDYVIIEINDRGCIELDSVTGKVSLCDDYWCTD